MDEKPRDVFIAGCQAMAQALAEDGFNATRNGQLLRRQRGEFREEIYFQSSHYNSPGHVAVMPAATVESADFARWRGNDTPSAAVIAASNIGNLGGSGYMRVDIGDPRDRNAVLADVVGTVRRLAFPWFDLVEQADALSSAAERGPVPGFLEHVYLAEYLVYIDRRGVAASVLAKWFQSNPSGLPEFEHDRVARLVDRHQLPVMVPPPMDVKQTLIAHLRHTLEAVALSNPDLPANSRDIPRR